MQQFLVVFASNSAFCMVQFEITLTMIVNKEGAIFQSLKY